MNDALFSAIQIKQFKVMFFAIFTECINLYPRDRITNSMFPVKSWNIVIICCHRMKIRALGIVDGWSENGKRQL